MQRRWILAAGLAVALVVLLGAAFTLVTRTGPVQAAASAIKTATVASITGMARAASAVAKTAEHSGTLCEQMCDEDGAGATVAIGAGAACMSSKDAATAGAEACATEHAALAADHACSFSKGAAVAAKRGCSFGKAAGWMAGMVCSDAKDAAVPALVARGGVLTGDFDGGVSSACQGACVTRTQFTAERVMPQPGAKVGQLTQCPVSGVVFEVKKNNARVALDGGAIYSCCGSCAARLEANPTRYLKV